MAKPGKPQQGSAVKVVEALVRPVVEGMGLRLWDVRFEKEGPDWFLRVLIDDYIAPLLLEAAPVFTGLIHAILIRCWTRQTPLNRATTSRSAARAWAAA